jgi:uncharacterized membrane protein HdeD (DUF308 family)
MEGKEMTIVLTRNWWVLALRGVAAIIFGILTFLMPGITLAALVLLFGAFAITDGIFAIIAAIKTSGKERKWWLLIISGVLSIIVGVLTFVMPEITALFLLYLIAFWAIFTGTLAIATAIRLRKEITGEWLMALGGIASVLFGVLLLLFPGAGALAVVLWIGAYALVSGAIMLALAFKLRSWNRELQHHGEMHPA